MCIKPCTFSDILFQAEHQSKKCTDDVTLIDDQASDRNDNIKATPIYTTIFKYNSFFKHGEFHQTLNKRRKYCLNSYDYLQDVMYLYF